MRDYQVDGVNWLSSCYYKRSGAILADEMGLGKTGMTYTILSRNHYVAYLMCHMLCVVFPPSVQIVSYLEHLYRVEKLHGPFLVVVPLSTVEHWRREFEGWTDMQCCVYHDRQVRAGLHPHPFVFFGILLTKLVIPRYSGCGEMSYVNTSFTIKTVLTLQTTSNSMYWVRVVIFNLPFRL